MIKLSDLLELRVRYSETDQMGTFYNSRALEWFECGRSELMRRQLGMSYAELESQGVFLPLVQAHLEFLGGARYDDLLEIESVVELEGRARLRFVETINHAGTARPSCEVTRFMHLLMELPNRSAHRGGFWKNWWKQL